MFKERIGGTLCFEFRDERAKQHMLAAGCKKVGCHGGTEHVSVCPKIGWTMVETEKRCQFHILGNARPNICCLPPCGSQVWWRELARHTSI